jgi:hypothetical protein
MKIRDNTGFTGAGDVIRVAADTCNGSAEDAMTHFFVQADPSDPGAPLQ